MRKVKNFEDLEIWQLAKQLAVKIYRLLKTFPLEEKFGIVAQTKDAVVSIAGNIAEGYGRFHFKDRIKFYYNSRGSLLETKSHLSVSKALGFINQNNRLPYGEIIKDIQVLHVKLNNYITTVRKTSKTTTNKQSLNNYLSNE